MLPTVLAVPSPDAPPSTRARHVSTGRFALVLLVVSVAVFCQSAIFAHWHDWFFAAAFAYAGVSVLAVCVLYFYAARGRYPGPVLKGLHAPWLQVIFLPYRFVAWLVTLAARIARRGGAISPIAPGIYLGARLFHHEAHMLHALGVRCVVDLCAEAPTAWSFAREPFARLEVPVLDRCPPSPAEVEMIADWVADRRAAGESVYIHCAFGRGRSAMVAAAVLLRLGLAKSAHEAVAQLTRARSLVSVKGDQLVALEQYAERLAGAGAATAPAPPCP